MSDLFEISVQDMISEVEREIAQRYTVYQRLIAAGKLNLNVARRRIAIMQAIADALRRGDQ